MFRKAPNRRLALCLPQSYADATYSGAFNMGEGSYQVYVAQVDPILLITSQARPAYGTEVIQGGKGGEPADESSLGLFL